MNGERTGQNHNITNNTKRVHLYTVYIQLPAEKHRRVFHLSYDAKVSRMNQQMQQAAASSSSSAPQPKPHHHQHQLKLLRAKDQEIAALQERCNALSHQLQTTLLTSAEKKRRHHPLSPHAVNIREVPVPTHHNNNTTIPSISHSISTGNNIISNNSSGINNNNGDLSKQQQKQQQQQRVVCARQRERIGRNASMSSRLVLDKLVQNQQHHPSVKYTQVVQRVLDMFQNPTQHMEYLNSNAFAQDVLSLCKGVKGLLESEPRVVFLQSPCYVFGDIHGNLEDLHFFSDNIWRLGMSLTAGNFLFLGDYVDRGMNCLETVAYLLAMKQQLPSKVYLLRGNHETRDVNGWEEHYAERSFLWQCRNRFGDDLGYRLWEACNAVFDRLPLAAVIDQDIFCVHGGIPRSVRPTTTRIQDILTVPRVAGINPPYQHEDDRYQQVASDCIWSDPASEDQERHSVNPNTGFGESLRGGGAICFGSKAVTDFLTQQDFSFIMRAHEAHADGVAVSKGARVFTVFSTSQDHNQGSQAMAGCMLVDNEKLQVINRSPACKYCCFAPDSCSRL